MRRTFLLAIPFFYGITFGQNRVSDEVTLTAKENSVKVLSSTSASLTIEVNIGRFNSATEFIDTEEFSLLWLKNESRIMEEGKPELPRIVRSIRIPASSGVVGNIIESEYEDIQMSVAPAKGVLEQGINPDDVPYVFSAVYSENKFFPEERFSFGDPYIMRNVRGAAMVIYPFTCNPVAQTLKSPEVKLLTL